MLTHVQIVVEKRKKEFLKNYDLVYLNYFPVARVSCFLHKKPKFERKQETKPRGPCGVYDIELLAKGQKASRLMNTRHCQK